MSILITKNTLHQLNLEGKKRNLAFLGNKNFKDKNGNSKILMAFRLRTTQGLKLGFIH